MNFLALAVIEHDHPMSLFHTLLHTSKKNLGAKSVFCVLCSLFCWLLLLDLSIFLPTQSFHTTPYITERRLGCAPKIGGSKEEKGRNTFSINTLRLS